MDGDSLKNDTPTSPINYGAQALACVAHGPVSKCLRPCPDPMLV